jgi:hypothetical protein
MSSCIHRRYNADHYWQQHRSPGSSTTNIKEWKLNVYSQWQPIGLTRNPLPNPTAWTQSPTVQPLVMTAHGPKEVAIAAEGIISIVTANINSTILVLPAGVTCVPNFDLHNIFAHNSRFTLYVHCISISDLVANLSIQE